MKKICQILLAFFVIGLLMQIIYVFISKGYTLKYDIKEGTKHFLVEEKYIGKQKEVKAHYEITVDNAFTFQIYDNLYKDSRLIKNIKYYKDGTYTCIYPVFKNKKTKRDVLCKDKEKQIYYQNINGNASLDLFVSKLPGYDRSLFKDQKNMEEKEKFLTVYTENLLKDHSLIVQNYKGAYSINSKNNKKINSISLYKQDVYDPKLSVMVGKYFVTADYNEEFSFHKFYILDSVNDSKKEIKTNYDISYDSYIQGVVDDKIYLIDKEHKRQYKIDIDTKKVSLVGDVNKGILFYQDGKFARKEISDSLNSTLLFEEEILLNSSYYKMEKTSNSSYTYLFKKANGKIEVSRITTEKKELPVYLFSVPEVKMVRYQKDFIYFVCEGTIYYYSDETSLRTLAKQSEFSFNENLKYFIYAR